jgi:hypothetical protein
MKSTPNRLLAIVIAMQALTLLGQWTAADRPRMVSPAGAQVPDAGGQRLQMIDQLKQTNQKLDRLVTLLESGKLQVVASVPDDSRDRRDDARDRDDRGRDDRGGR